MSSSQQLLILYPGAEPAEVPMILEAVCREDEGSSEEWVEVPKRAKRNPKPKKIGREGRRVPSSGLDSFARCYHLTLTTAGSCTPNSELNKLTLPITHPEDSDPSHFSESRILVS